MKKLLLVNVIGILFVFFYLNSKIDTKVQKLDESFEDSVLSAKSYEGTTERFIETYYEWNKSKLNDILNRIEDLERGRK